MTSMGKSAASLKLVRLGDVAEKIAMGPFGSNIKVETFVDSGVPVISGAHLNGIKLEDTKYNFISDEHAARLKSSAVYRGDIVFTHAGNIGQVAYIPEDSKYEKYVLSQRQFYLRPNKKFLDAKYLTYYFKTRMGQHQLLANANQTGVPSIAQPASYLKSLEIELPTIEQQKEIAAILSSLDDKIELLREQNKTLEAIAQTLFNTWFTGESDNNEYIDNFVQFNPSEKVISNQEYMFYDMKCVSTDSMIIKTGLYKSVKSSTAFRNGDTLMAKITPCLENGKIGFVSLLEEGQVARGSTEFIVMRAKKGTSPQFVYCLARNDKFHDYAIKSMTGTSGRQRVQIDLLKRFKLNINCEQMDKFEIVSKPLFEKISSNQRSIMPLTEIRRKMMDLLFEHELAS